MNPEVQLKTNDKTGIFFIEIDGKEEAMMSFFMSLRRMKKSLHCYLINAWY